MTAPPALVRRLRARTARPRRRAVVGLEARFVSPVPPRGRPGGSLLSPARRVRIGPTSFKSARRLAASGSPRRCLTASDRVSGTGARNGRSARGGRSRTLAHVAQSGRGGLRAQRSVRATPSVDGRLNALLERGGAGHRVHRRGNELTDPCAGAASVLALDEVESVLDGDRQSGGGRLFEAVRQPVGQPPSQGQPFVTPLSVRDGPTWEITPRHNAGARRLSAKSRGSAGPAAGRSALPGNGHRSSSSKLRR